MKIAIFGSNPRAVALGQLLVQGGYRVCFGDDEGMQPAEEAAERAGAVADTPYNDASVCDMWIFAGSRERIDDLLAQTGRITHHTVVVDAMEEVTPGDESGAALLARKLDTHRVIRALITAPKAGANVIYCGDDADAMTMFEEVFRTAGCITTDRGSLANAAQIAVPAGADSG